MSGSKDEIDILPPQVKYSKYAGSLDRIFKNNSLEVLQYNLKNPKTFKPREFYEEYKSSKNNAISDKNEKLDKLPELKNSNMIIHNQADKKIKIPEKVNLNELNSSKLKDTELYNLNKSVDNNEVKNAKDYFKMKAKKRMKLLLSDMTPDPGKYNPNWDSVLKRVPNVIFIKSPKSNTTSKPITQNIEKAQSLNENILNKSILSENEKSVKTNPQLQDVVNPRYALKNNALRFSQYSLRKTPQRKMWQLPIISYLEPHDYIKKNKGIKFEKMSDRKENELINISSLGNPSICYYKPNYEYVLKKSPRSIKFSPKSDKKDISKQYLIQKMWRSYDVSTDYKLVKLKSYADENKL